jgi:hypothetical protein
MFTVSIDSHGSNLRPELRFLSFLGWRFGGWFGSFWD